MPVEPPDDILAAPVRRILETAPESRLPMTYQQLAEALGLTPPRTIQRVAQALEALMREDAKVERPFVAALVVSRRGDLLASRSYDGTVRLWDVLAWKVKATIPDGKIVAGAVLFSIDGQTLLTGHADGQLRLWETASWQEKSALPAHAKEVRALAGSPDGLAIASAGNDGQVRIWDAANGDEWLTIEAHRSAATAVAFAPAGNLLASAGLDHIVKLWNSIEIVTVQQP